MPTPATAKDAAHMYKIKRQDKYQQQQLQLRASQSDVVPAPLSGTKQQKQLTRGAHGLNKKLLKWVSKRGRAVGAGGRNAHFGLN